MAAEPLKSAQPVFVPVPEDLPEDFDLRELGYSHQSVRLPDGSTRSAYVVPSGFGAADSGTVATPAHKPAPFAVSARTQNRSKIAPRIPATPLTKQPHLPLKEQLKEQLILCRAKLLPRLQTEAFGRFRLFSLLGLGALLVAGCILWVIGQNAAAPSEVRLQITYRSQLEGQRQLAASPALLKTVETQLVVEESIAATGLTQIPDQKASGQVRISNTTERTLGLSSGTLIATVNGVGYRLTQNISVPASNFAAGQLGSAVATIQADKAGPVGNLPNGLGTLNLAQGLKAAGISPLTGGTMREAKTVSKADLETLQQKLDAQLGARATEAATAKIEPGWRTLEPNQAATVAETKIVIELTEGAEAPADGKISGKLVARLTIPVYNPAAIAEQMQAEAPASALSSLNSAGRDGSTGDRTALPVLPAPVYGPLTVKQVTLATNPAAGAETPQIIVSYSQALAPPNLQKMLDGWAMNNRANLDKLLVSLKERPDVELVRMTVIEPQKASFKLRILG